MSDYLPFLVIGLTTGSVYGLAATGLVLCFRTSRILNFAQGSIATVTVLIFLALVYRANIPWQIAALVAIVGVGPLVGMAVSVLARRLTPQTTETKVLATIGLLLFVSGGVILWGSRAFGSHPEGRPTLPGTLIHVGGVNIGVDQLIIISVGLLTTVMLHLALEHTATGRSMRAVVDNEELLGLTGRNPYAAVRAGWALGTAFVTLAGLLLVIAPNDSVPVQNLNLLVFQAFGAAAVGGFSNLPLTYAGGLIIGIVSALATKFVVTIPLLGGLPSGVPFIVLFVLLILVPGHFARSPEAPMRQTPRRIIQVPAFYRSPSTVLACVALIAILLSRSVHLLYTANEGLAYAVLFLGLGLLVRTSAQVSLCQMSLAAVGAATFSHLTQGFGLPWLPALLVAGVAAGGVGAVVAIPAIRVAGIYVAVATFGFGILLEEFLYPTRLLFGTTGGTPISRPAFWGIDGNHDRTFFILLLIIFFAGTTFVVALRRSRLGRLLRALGDSPLALEAQGTAVDLTKVVVFSISAFFAGVGGALLVSQLRFLLTGPFDSMASLTVFVVLATIRVGEPFAALLASAAFVVVPSFLSARGQVWWLDVAFGAAAMLVALTAATSRLPRWTWASPARTERKPAIPSIRWSPRGWPHDRLSSSDSPHRPRRSDVKRIGLEVKELTVRYKGTIAVNDLSLRVPMGQITGLIGPNGAGKTTTFDFCSGLVRGQAGQVLLSGLDITRKSTSARARLGLGRTFQRAHLFGSLTVDENVALGAEGAMAGRNPMSQFVASRDQARRVKRAAADAMQLVGIEHLAHRDVRALSTGELRLVAIARCLAGNFQVLLLDEPAAGLDASETEIIGDLLLRITAERDVGILLVEHDVSLVTKACSYLYVLDFGSLVFEGDVAQAMSSEAVRAAYLGETALPNASVDTAPFDGGARNGTDPMPH